MGRRNHRRLVCRVHRGLERGQLLGAAPGNGTPPRRPCLFPIRSLPRVGGGLDAMESPSKARRSIGHMGNGKRRRLGHCGERGLWRRSPDLWLLRGSRGYWERGCHRGVDSGQRLRRSNRWPDAIACLAIAGSSDSVLGGTKHSRLGIEHGRDDNRRRRRPPNRRQPESRGVVAPRVARGGWHRSRRDHGSSDAPAAERAQQCLLGTSSTARSLTFPRVAARSPTPRLHLLHALLATARSSLRSQRELALENLAFVGGLHHRYTRRAA